MQSLPLDKFKKELKKYSEKTLPKRIKDVQKMILLEVYRRILQRTPVLTGRARRNWFLALRTPSLETTEETAGVFVTGVPMTAQERFRLSAINRELDSKPLGETVWITNNLVYTQFLERGSSNKAPDGIVEGAILGALEVIKSRSGGTFR